jgi:signal transduction histidine kinase/CheY-like chemotaxis protein
MPVKADLAATPPLSTLANSVAHRKQRVFAGAFCLVVLAVGVALGPQAPRILPAMPGFVACYQAALIVVYALSAYLFFAQFKRTHSCALLVLGIGALYTTLIVALQLLTFPNIFGLGRVLGSSPETTTWLWTFWHLGPPLFALPYAIMEGDGRARVIRRGRVAAVGWLAALATAASVGVVGVVVTRFVDHLPHQVEGDDYSLLTTSGVGPALVALTALVLIVLCATTRLRTVLQLWLAVALFLLIGDSVITMMGGARGSVGWVAGRLEALVAGTVVLGVYLREIDFLYGRAEQTATERERERADLQVARDSLAIALDAADMAHWELDLVTGTSRRTLKHDQIFGFDTLQPHWGQAELFARVWPEDLATVRAAFARGAERGAFEVEFRIRRAGDDAKRWIALRGRSYTAAGGDIAGMVGVVMDTTERHDTEERLNQSQKMEAIGQLTGGVAHDFNNLLTIIVGNLDMILRRPDNVQRVQRLAESGLGAARRGAEVTQKLLAFSRRQVLRPETVNPNGLLQGFRGLLGRAVGATVRIEFHLDPALHPVRLDPGQFENAILNMAVNARDAMPDGGLIAVTTGNASLDAADVADMPELAPGDYVVVAMTDTGSGMDAPTMARVFEPFFTTKDVGKGTGLGLSQVYGFAKQAGGHVRIESRPGWGTTFRLYLPRSVERPKETRPKTNAMPLRRATDGEVVLVVEDEPAVLAMAVESLEELGYRTRTATDAADALRQLRGVDRIDLLFSDVIMPGGMNGVQLSVEARRLRPTLRLLLTSGYTGASFGADGIPDDVPLLTKPYLREDLADRLRVVLAR